MNDTHDGSTGAAQSNLAAYLAEAKHQFDTIAPLWETAGNVWRTACAFDSLLDYFVVSGIDSAPYGRDALTALDPTLKGNWWDDFGWIGIAALRAAELGFASAHRLDFLKIAINSWCYMCGPGWSTDPNQHDIYPYTDPPGWAAFARSHPRNYGAPNAWGDIPLTWPSMPSQLREEVRPRYSPGGIWNSTFTSGSTPVPSSAYEGTGDVLNPIQNTVTNGVFALLSLRLYLATKNPGFASYFTDVKFNTEACNQAWKNQIAWWQQWMLETPDPIQALLLTTQTGSRGGSLVRERVSSFHAVQNVVYWDSSYNKSMTWSGDQGLLIGALREAQAMHQSSPPAVLGLYPDLIRGSFANYFQPRTYGSVSGSFPLPWLEVGAKDPFNAWPPGNDFGDYQTGVGIFMRYLLQAYHADPKLVEPYRQAIIAVADALINPGFGAPAPAGQCDAFTAYGSDNADLISAHVNRLAVLTLAIAMS